MKALGYDKYLIEKIINEIGPIITNLLSIFGVE